MADLIQGETRTLVLRATHHGAQTRPPPGVPTWSVSDATVGTVTPITADGLKAKFFALDGGTCEVTAVLRTLVATRTFRVLGEADALEILVEEDATTPPAIGAVILLDLCSAEMSSGAMRESLGTLRAFAAVRDPLSYLTPTRTDYAAAGAAEIEYS